MCCKRVAAAEDLQGADRNHISVLFVGEKGVVFGEVVSGVGDLQNGEGDASCDV